MVGAVLNEKEKGKQERRYEENKMKNVGDNFGELNKWTKRLQTSLK